MNINSFQPEHKIQIKKWLKQWNLSYAFLDMIPSTGFIINDIAALFAYETNSSVFFIEGLISNKEIEKHIVREAIDELISHTINTMTNKGYKYAIGSSNLETVIETVKRFEFDVNDRAYKVFSKELFNG